MSIADAFRQTAAQIGANPLDLATVASYESGGKLNPAVMGGAGGRYAGIFQFGPWEQQHYGVSNRSTAEQQVEAAGRFLKDRGFKPGMGLLDMYSAINAGRVGRYNASDAGNGGAPGTVRDKVEKQMGGHVEKARALLGALGGASDAPPAGQTPQAGTDLAAALGPGVTLPTLAPAVPVVLPAEPDPTIQTQQAQQLQEQRAQQEQQRKQALLSVSAFYR
ncbi:hypothetical protein SAMN04488144_103267 [Methylobacterium sp. 190mf]|uniref:hypothetical protein n=1 Tax=Methylobacterium sp. 190mf TaxID=1761798 RepID=UPI00089F77ED|nr:hypothetical protein [Methylobacterium sp. 190mf]SEF68193.1 hypothetical protein SAMN04488144_103267 [Methylobacterium sp. 190mf]